MKKWWVILLLLSVLFASGCSSSKLVTIGLDDAIQLTWNKLGEAHCKNKVTDAVIATDSPDMPCVAFQAITASKIDLGVTVPVYVVPITLSGEGSLSESTTITVKFNLRKYDCGQVEEVETKSGKRFKSYEVDKISRTLKRIKFYEFDKRTGTITEQPATAD